MIVRSHLKDFNERFIHLGDIALNVSENKGGNPPLLLIHGWGESWQTWRSVLPLLALHYDVSAVDLRGFGRSGRVDHRQSRNTWVSDISRLIELISPKGTWIIGHSLGGWIGMMLAKIIPIMVHGVLAEDPFTGPLSGVQRRASQSKTIDWAARAESLREVNSVAELSKRLRLKHPEFSLERSLELATMRFRTDPYLLESLNQTSVDHNDNFQDVFRLIERPVLVLQADYEKGGIMPDIEANRLRRTISKSKVVKWSDSGHFIHIERSVDFVKIFNKFSKTDWTG